eukprot:scaffold175227_cov51-Prasinocladus_malaysianus.AAC.1
MTSASIVYLISLRNVYSHQTGPQHQFLVKPSRSGHFVREGRREGVSRRCHVIAAEERLLWCSEPCAEQHRVGR